MHNLVNVTVKKGDTVPPGRGERIHDGGVTDPVHREMLGHFARGHNAQVARTEGLDSDGAGSNVD
jgi:hypothetical protein